MAAALIWPPVSMKMRVKSGSPRGVEADADPPARGRGCNQGIVGRGGRRGRWARVSGHGRATLPFGYWLRVENICYRNVGTRVRATPPPTAALMAHFRRFVCRAGPLGHATAMLRPHAQLRAATSSSPWRCFWRTADFR